MLANGPLKILAVYLSPSWPLIDLDLSACLGGGVPVLMVADLNAKHMDWNSRLITTGGRLGCNYANENSCLIYRSDTPTTLPYNSSTTPDVLDIVFTKNLVTTVYLSTCSALGWGHLFDQHTVPWPQCIWPHAPHWAEVTYLINTQCRSSFSIYRITPISDRLGQIPGLSGGWTSVQHKPAKWGGSQQVCQETVQCYFEGVGRVHSQESHMMSRVSQYRVIFRMKYAWTTC